MMTKMKLGSGPVDSKVADMMIKGNTKGMVKGLKNTHKLRNPDQQINALSQKLLDSERANIRQMQGFV